MPIYKSLIISVVTVCSVSALTGCGCSGSDSVSQVDDSSVSAETVIRLNQIGFYPGGRKTAAVTGGSSVEFSIVSTIDGVVKYSGTLGNTKVWPYSNETVQLADFSSFNTPGRYRVSVQGLDDSHEFEINDMPYRDLNIGALKAYYFNRASLALDQQYAGQWARAAGHPDITVIVHASAASALRPEGTMISSPEGWYDAADYNKYIVNSGISTYTLLAAYEHFGSYYVDLQTNIPESGNAMPDILDEAAWNIRWMLTMQEPVAAGGDGGVYHKLTTQNFAGFVMPEQATATRYVVQKTTAAALDFAAVMAVAARVYQPFDSGFATQCRNAAIDALAWADANPSVPYVQPADIHTGGYGSGADSFADEFAWTAAELYITTGDDNYYSRFLSIWPDVSVPSWGNVAGLAWISLAHHRSQLSPAADIPAIENAVVNLANTLISAYRNSAYGVVMGALSNDFVWGSNSVALNQAMVLIQAYRLNNDSEYLEAVQANLDYVLGRNATGYSFVTGFGDRTPQFIHHRQSGSDGITEPVPGFIVGGPQPNQQDDHVCPAYPSSLPAKSYLDHQCSYASNEVAINWNAPLVYVSGALEVLVP
ncbi:MAG: glycoside hydrolase family 9 protein [Gammaproteobacteria bacterium]|nr:glycoside hydrolase family 9 protein [Gammaproteobacteria bacterium]